MGFHFLSKDTYIDRAGKEGAIELVTKVMETHIDNEEICGNGFIALSSFMSVNGKGNKSVFLTLFILK